jgi:hypothetical protein
MATLNQLASNVAHLLGQPLNETLKERIKDDYKYLRVKYYRQSIERYGVDQVIKVSYIVPLEVVDIADNCIIDIGCNISRSINTVGRPMRYKTDTPFTFVGTPDGYSFTYIRNISEERYRRYIKNVSKGVLWMYLNDYIYLFDDKIKQIKVEGVPENPEQWITICDDTTCYNDDMEFPLSYDVVESITTEIFKLYGVKPIEDKTVEMNVEHKDNVR